MDWKVYWVGRFVMLSSYFMRVCAFSGPPHLNGLTSSVFRSLSWFWFCFWFGKGLVGLGLSVCPALLLFYMHFVSGLSHLNLTCFRILISRSFSVLFHFCMEKKNDKQRTQKGIWWSVCLRSATGTVGGELLGHAGRPRLISVQFHIDWTQRPRDRRDVCTGQTGHVHGMVAIQKRRWPTKLLSAYWLFLFPILVLLLKDLGAPVHRDLPCLVCSSFFWGGGKI